MQRIRHIGWIILTWIAPVVTAQDNGFTASAPGSVAVGEQFRYVIEGSEQGEVILPTLDGFQLLAGPFSSFSSHSQWVNGQMTMETVVTYTHILRATREGERVIPAATVRVGRKEYETNVVRITARPGNTPPPQGSSPGSGSGADSDPAAGANQGEGSEPVFLRVIPSRREVFLGEQFVSGLKVYTRVNTQPASAAKDIPYEGFYKQSLEPDESARRQEIDGQPYVTQVIQRHILIPQKTGEIEIAPYESEWMVQQRVQRRSRNSVFDSFFDDPFFSGVQQIPTTLSTLPVTIDVKPLPSPKPSGFTGAVGDFSLVAELSAAEVAVNEALTLKVTVRGTGNLPLLGTPEVNLPPDHDAYDVTRSVNTSTSGNRISGSVTFEYPLVARHAGNFRIPPIDFSWFDPSAGEYRSTRSPEFSFTVIKGESAEPGDAAVFIPGVNRESVADIGRDIRDIHRTVPAFTPVASTVLGNPWYRWIYISALLLAVGAFVVLRIVSRRNADLRLVRTRKASKSARARLKKADRYRRAGEADRFYEETGKAIWGYLADKLGMEISDLTREGVAASLMERNVGEDQVREMRRILDDSEFSRFAPTSEKSDVERLYQDSLALIRNLESKL